MRWGSKLSVYPSEWPQLLQGLAAIGYSYGELPGYVIAQLTDEAFRELAQSLQEQPLPVEAVFALLPPGLKLVGPDARLDEAITYLRELFGRLRQLRIKFAVWDGGEARTLPKAFPRDQGQAQVERFLQAAVQAAEDEGLVLLIAPVNRKESNMLRTVEEAVELAANLYTEHAKVCSDSCDMLMEKEEYDSITESVDMHLLAHSYLSDRDRTFPGQPAENGVDFGAYLGVLREAGYIGSVTIYGRFENKDDLLQQAKLALETIRPLY